MKSVSAKPSKKVAQKIGAEQQGRERTEAVYAKVRGAMLTIETEILANEGIYPGNGGALPLNEVWRRADVHNTTLHGDKHVDMLKEVKDWHTRMKAGAVTGRLRVRKTLATRVSEWKELYEHLQQSERDTNLALQQRDAELEAATAEILSLRAEVEKLRSQVAVKSGKVVSLRGTGQRS